MDAIHFLFLSLALAAFGVAVWLALRNGRLMGESSQVRQALAEAREQIQRDAVTIAQGRQELERVAQRANAFENDLIQARTLLQEREKAHQQQLEASRGHLQEQERALREQSERAFAEIESKFKALAGDALAQSTRQIMELAGQSFASQRQATTAELDQRKQAIEAKLGATVGPVLDALRRTEDKIAALDRERTQTAATLGEQLKSVAQSTTELREQTRKLGDALRRPEVRGRYGELQLRRVVELAGMTPYCDFALQQSVPAGPDAAQPESLKRPDLIVKLPNDRQVVVDAKTNIQAYIDAAHAPTPEQAEALLAKFAQHVAKQASDLARKEYWKEFEGSPEFVVMFVPGDQFLDAALARQPDLLEQAARQGVILASPATLIALLKAVAVGYREHRLAKHAEELRALGREFHERIATALEFIEHLGAHLAKATRSYNDFIASYSSRLLPTLAKFEESGVRGKKDRPALSEVEVLPRSVPGSGQGVRTSPSGLPLPPSPAGPTRGLFAGHSQPDSVTPE